MNDGNRHFHVSRRFCGRLVLAAFFFLLIACQGASEKPASAVPEKIILSYPKTLLSVLPHIAMEKGYFTAAGLDVALQVHAYGKLALQSVLDDKADLAVSADTPFMFAVMGGEKIYVCAVMGTSRKSIAVLARKDRGIARPEDLKGKRVGLSLGTAREFYFDSLLFVRGIDRKNISIIDMHPEEMADALAQGRVDAVSVSNSYLARLERTLKGNGVSFYGETLYSDKSCLISRQEFSRTRPAVIRKVLQALLAAEAYVKKHPEEAQRLIAHLTGMDLSYLREIWPLNDFNVTMSPSLLASLEDQTHWAQRRGRVKTRTPNYIDFMYLDALSEIKPGAVQITR